MNMDMSNVSNKLLASMNRINLEITLFSAFSLPTGRKEYGASPYLLVSHE